MIRCIPLQVILAGMSLFVNAQAPADSGLLTIDRIFHSPEFRRESAPDIYQRTMLRRSQENELFNPVDPAMVPYLLRHISTVDKRVLPCDRNQLQQLVKILPTE